MKRIQGFYLMLLFTAVLFFISPGSVCAGEASISDNDNGSIHISFNNTYDARVKLIVQQSGGKMYQYDIPKGDVSVNIPLTGGNGEYRITLAKNISGSKYSVLQTTQIKEDVSDDTECFLTSNIIIDWETTNKAIKKANSLTKGKSGDTEKFNAVYKYIVKNFSYDYDKLSILDSLAKGSSYIPDIDTIYSKKKGICYDISILMASMLRSVDIPTKVVTGYSDNARGYHAWNNVYLSDWKIVDATYDLQMRKANRKYSTYKSSKEYKKIVYTY